MNNEFIMESLQNEVHTQQSPLEVRIIVKKTQQSGNFMVGEDCLIVLTLLNISMDAMQGNEQVHKTYWNRVWNYFHKERTYCLYIFIDIAKKNKGDTRH